MRNVKVFYEADEINEKFDDEIIEFMRTKGFEFWASGYDLVRGVRDLAFERGGRFGNEEESTNANIGD